mmetsp:Transcript_56614/g.113372  ORF Transcript_56614/g.113372 Transcript_56614/m.113372 type:complete len:302 (+) Transcript_56614:425-1330(+)
MFSRSGSRFPPTTLLGVVGGTGSFALNQSRTATHATERSFVILANSGKRAKRAFLPFRSRAWVAEMEMPEITASQRILLGADPSSPSPPPSPPPSPLPVPVLPCIVTAVTLLVDDDDDDTETPLPPTEPFSPSPESSKLSTFWPLSTFTPLASSAARQGSNRHSVAEPPRSQRTSKSAWCSSAKKEKHDKAPAAETSKPGAMGRTSKSGSRNSAYRRGDRPGAVSNVCAVMSSHRFQALSLPSKSSQGRRRAAAVARSNNDKVPNFGMSAVPRGAGRRSLESPRTGATTLSPLVVNKEDSQ